MIFDKSKLYDIRPKNFMYNLATGMDDLIVSDLYGNKSQGSISAENKGFETVLFNKDLTHLIHCPVTATGSYVVPDSVEKIGVEAFSKCRNVCSVSLPVSLKNIGCLAFESCISLRTILIPESVEELGYRIFSDCTGLKSIYVQAKEPLKLETDSDLFFHVDTSNCILYVPQGSKKMYQYAPQWREFKNVVELKPVRKLATLN